MTRIVKYSLVLDCLDYVIVVINVIALVVWL